jgi:hypothetical protein
MRQMKKTVEQVVCFLSLLWPIISATQCCNYDGLAYAEVSSIEGLVTGEDSVGRRIHRNSGDMSGERTIRCSLESYLRSAFSSNSSLAWRVDQDGFR